MIIALGESIVAIGVGAELGVDAGVVVAAVLGIAVAAALWWLYFDVVAIVSERRLVAAAPGRERNKMARDSYSYLHFPMVAGIVLVALGMKKTLAHVEDPLKLVPTFALLGGTALYLLVTSPSACATSTRSTAVVSGLRSRCWRWCRSLDQLPALATLGILATLLVALISYETRIYGEARQRVRHPEAAEP